MSHFGNEFFAVIEAFFYWNKVYEIPKEKVNSASASS